MTDRIDRAVVADLEATRRRLHEASAAEATLQRRTDELLTVKQELRQLEKELAAARRATQDASSQLDALRTSEQEAVAAAHRVASERQAFLIELEQLRSEVGDRRSITAQLERVTRERDIFRDRLQAVYDLKWSRLGAALRRPIDAVRGRGRGRKR